MTKRPKTVYMLILLWLILSVIFIAWGGISLGIVLQVPTWTELNEYFISQFHFGYLVSTIVWFVFSSLFIIFSYGTFRADSWVWTTGLIISTIFLVVFSFMLFAFVVNALRFYDQFSVLGLTTVLLGFVVDLGIIFYITRPKTKIYFNVTD